MKTMILPVFLFITLCIPLSVNLEMKALDCNDELTPLGRILARLPIEPRLGRMLVFACAFRLGGAMALLAAHSSFGSDVFSVPPDRRRLSWDQIRFAAGSNSDHLAALNVFQVWSAEVQHGGDQAAAYLCDLRELNGSSLRMIEDAASQVGLIDLTYSTSRPKLSIYCDIFLSRFEASLSVWIFPSQYSTTRQSISMVAPARPTTTSGPC